MKQKIATHIITGFLGAGKTTYMNNLFAQKPTNEKWVVIVNELGNSDYAKQRLMSLGIVVKELYGGCLCCSAGMPFRVALNQLINKEKPQRIFIEPAGAGHLENIKGILQGEFYQTILAIKSTLCLLSQAQLSDPQLNENEHYVSLITEADKLCFYEESAQKLVKKMAMKYSKPFYQLLYQLDDLT